MVPLTPRQGWFVFGSTGLCYLNKNHEQNENLRNILKLQETNGSLQKQPQTCLETGKDDKMSWRKIQNTKQI